MKSGIKKRAVCWILSVLVSILAVVLVYVLQTPNPMMVLIIPVVFFAYWDGYMGGSLSGAVAVLYSLYFFSNADRLFTYNDLNIQKVITIVITVTVIVVLVGKLKARSKSFVKEIGHANKNFLKILSGMDVQLLVTDPEDDRILFANEKMNRGYDVDYDPVGQSCWQVYHGFSERCAICPLKELYKNPEVPYEWEHFNKRTERWFHNRESMIEWTDGRMVHLQQGIDITGRKKAAEIMRRRLEQQELMSAISQSFISLDDTGKLIDKALRKTGEFLKLDRCVLYRLGDDNDAVFYENGWLSPRTKDVSKGGDKLRMVTANVKAIRDAFQDGATGQLVCENVALHPFLFYDEGIVIQSLLVLPIYLHGGLWGMISLEDSRVGRVWDESEIILAQMIRNTISGVLDRDRMESQLLRLSSIVDSSPQYVTYMDKDGGLRYINQGAVELSGYSREELASAGVWRIFDDDTAVYVKREVIPEILRSGTWSGQLKVRRGDGRSRIWNCSAFTTGFKEGGMAIMANDITKMVELEDAMLEAKNLAEQSNQAKSEFLSRMSHEIRTPMNAIIGMTAIAGKSDDMERVRECLMRIGDASDHLLGVINDILDMSKIEAGKFELSNSDFVLEHMLQRVANVNNVRFEQKGQHFAIMVEPGVPVALITDQQRLAQVITNLLANAAKFTPNEGRVCLSIKLKDEDKNHVTLLFEVSDEGIGMSAEQQKHLFRSFEQADGSITRRFGGTGLGLAISKTIVEMMDGCIWVVSEPGKGSSFFFTVRVKKGFAKRSSCLSPNVDWSKVRLLAADTGQDVLSFFKAIAESLGIACDTANSVDSALACLRERNYQVVFIDEALAGDEAISTEFEGRLIVIMLFAGERAEIEKIAAKWGVKHFLEKPLLPSPIIDCINECFGERAEHIAQIDMETVRNVDIFLGRRLLLVEDVDVNREIIKAILEDTGVEIVEAENGETAVRLFFENPGDYDLIFMDIHMPVMDGYTATQAIRARQDVSAALAVPIIAMTANVFRQDIEQCLAAGMNDHVGKPVNAEEIIAKMKRYMPVGR